MISSICQAIECFQLDPNSPKFFGFSEFLAGLALMVLAWTIGDVRYRFRVNSAPLPLKHLTFGVVAIVGMLTLLTDLWRANGWLVPKGNLLTPASWQALLAATFFSTFLTWVWYAFVRRPTFGQRNAKRYAQTLYSYVLRGDSKELAVVGNELAYSAQALIKHATQRRRTSADRNQNNAHSLSEIEQYANEILLLIADKRLCRAIVESSSGTVLAIFHQISKTKKHDIQINIFAKNIIEEALTNQNSFLYHETMVYQSGLMGHYKPLSQAMFGNHEMVNRIGTLFDFDLGQAHWTALQWEAYCRLILITLNDFSKQSNWSSSKSLGQAIDQIQYATFNLRQMNGSPDTLKSNPTQNLAIVIKFISDAVKTINKNGVPAGLHKRVKVEYGHPTESVLDNLASLLFQVIFDASYIKSPTWECHHIQYNLIWSRLRFIDGPAGKLLKFKLRRILYNEIIELSNFANFQGSKILGFCLNVMGLELTRKRDHQTPLHKATLAWTTKSFVGVANINRAVAEDCLVEDIAYNQEKQQLIKTYKAEGLRNEPKHIVLQLLPDTKRQHRKIDRRMYY